ncbi:DUF1107 family protein [Aeromonas diversa]|nr:DUF1107 family protein [Aeromonas diversa]
MKIFKRFSPVQIARYVKSFHRGAFAVESVGEFRFYDGRVRLEGLSEQRALAGQVNQLLRTLRPDLASC